ncbi:MAG TPA: hypothetical protein VLD19_13250 [Chitinophagaceae bacterium]|nr:hypothetical protein [Chitinophagaceae bacterium]
MGFFYGQGNVLLKGLPWLGFGAFKGITGLVRFSMDMNRLSQVWIKLVQECWTDGFQRFGQVAFTGLDEMGFTGTDKTVFVRTWIKWIQGYGFLLDVWFACCLFKELSRCGYFFVFFYRPDDSTKMQTFTAGKNRAIRYVCIE